MDPQNIPTGSGQAGGVPGVPGMPGAVPPPPGAPVSPSQGGPVAPPPPEEGDQKPHEQILAALEKLQQKVDAIAAKVGV